MAFPQVSLVEPWLAVAPLINRLGLLDLPLGALRLSGDGGAFPSFILAGGDDRRLLPAARLPLRARARPEVDLQLQRSPLRCGKITFSSPGKHIGVTTAPSYFLSSAPLRIVDLGSRPLPLRVEVSPM